MTREDNKSWFENIPDWSVESGIVLLLVLTAWAVRQTVYVVLFTDSIGYLSFAGNILSSVNHADSITVAVYGDVGRRTVFLEILP